MADARAETGTAPGRGAGCGCKLPPDFLRGALSGITGKERKKGGRGGEEKGEEEEVYQLDDDRAIVASVDFFTPVVPDPALFGAIAATNALSDLYAMGATPLFALAVAAFPRSEGPDALAAILEAGAKTAAALGCPVIGGHSIDDPEIKYGLAAIGTARPDQVMRNDAGQPGDRLILTKALGTGIAVAGGGSALDAAVDSMCRSNADAGGVARAHDVRCATDVTGFGLAGHTHEIALASGCSARIDARAVPVLPGVWDLIAEGHETGGGGRNAAALADHLDARAVEEELGRLVVDPQTSGGLLLAVDSARVDLIVAELVASGQIAAIVGELTRGSAGRVEVV